MLRTTYSSILRDQLGGNGITVLYVGGQNYQRGNTSEENFITFLGERQGYFKSVVRHALTGDMFGGESGIVEETDGIGSQQFQQLGQLLDIGDWGGNPLLIEEFLQAIFAMRRTDYGQYKRPEWLDKVLS